MAEQLVDLINNFIDSARCVDIDREKLFGSNGLAYLEQLAIDTLGEEPEIVELMDRIAEAYEDAAPVVGDLFVKHNADFQRFTTALDFLVQVYVPRECVPVCGIGKAVKCLAIRSILLFYQLQEQAEEFEALMGDISEAGKCEKKGEEKDGE